MNDELKDRMELLSIELRRQQKKHRRSLCHSILFSAIILVFFSIYMALISYKIRELVTPKTVAVLIAEELRIEDAKYSRYANAELLAKETVRSGFSVLPVFGPLAEECLRECFSADTKEQTDKIVDVLAPVLYKSIDRVVHNRDLSELQLKQETGVILKNADRKEIRPGHAVLCTTPGYYAQYLNSIRMKDARQLTRQEQCMRDLFLCYLYFRHSNRYRDSNFSTLFDCGLIVLREFEFIK